MTDSQSLTVRSNGGLLRVLQSPCHVLEAWDPRAGTQKPQHHQFTAIWDTGATSSVVTDAVVAACGLRPISVVQVHGVHGPDLAEVFLVNIGLPNSVEFPHVRVTKGKLTGGCDVLIGMDIITVGDFAITNKGSTTVFTFRVPSMATFDFVKEHNARQAAMQKGGKRRR